jgi:hypothetical protein
MLTLVDGTAVTQCKLHTMEVDPIEPISMEVKLHSPIAPMRAIPLVSPLLASMRHAQANPGTAGRALLAGVSACSDRRQVRRSSRRHRRARMGRRRG